MSTYRHIDRICWAALALALAVTALFANGGRLGLQAAAAGLGYEARLFDASVVHTIDIVIDDWEGFLATCENEEYTLCALVIDGELQRSAAIRAKGNTSLTSVAAYGNDRYSFKVEFDHYDGVSSYYGLDKLNLNNIIQDNTYMKDFLTYQLMGRFGVASPLCSYVSLTVNGEPWGLYLAVEGVEDAFLRRNYGAAAEELYKPDSMDAGGRFGGGSFEGPMQDAGGTPPSGPPEEGTPPERPDGAWGGPDGGFPSDREGIPDGGVPNDREGIPDGGVPNDRKGFPGGGFPGGMGESDVKLQYIDDDPDSYPDIFDSAKTKITAADQDRLIAALKRLGSGEDIEGTVDVEQVIRYFVVHGFVCNGDSYTGSMVHNYYLYEQDGVLSMIPWDYNLAFGGFQSANASSVVNEPIDTPVTGGAVEDRPMLAWIFASEEYTALYHQYYETFLAECLDSGYCAGLIEETAAMIAPYVEEDPTKFCTYEEFETGVSVLRTFCQLRGESVAGQLTGTIPSTSQGQAEAGAPLVDASGLDLSDMGSMTGGGGRREDGSPDGALPDRRHGAVQKIQ